MSISVTPLSEAIGAEIKGVDLSLSVSACDVQIIHAAIEQNLVIVLRDQRFSPQTLLSGIRLFGETMEQHLTDTLMDEYPEIALLDSREMPPDKEGRLISFGGRDWHTDHTNHEFPPKFTALYAIKLPATGGDTSFANMQLAYDSLDVEEQKALSELKTVNKIEDFAYIDEKAREKFGTMPVHPLIRTHPSTHKKAIYVHPGKLECLVNMEAQDSHTLIRNLLDKVITPKISYRHKWREGDLLIVDNRAVLHLAHQDYDLREGRIMYRVLIKGERPI